MTFPTDILKEIIKHDLSRKEIVTFLSISLGDNDPMWEYIFYMEYPTLKHVPIKNVCPSSFCGTYKDLYKEWIYQPQFIDDDEYDTPEYKQIILINEHNARKVINRLHERRDSKMTQPPKIYTWDDGTIYEDNSSSNIYHEDNSGMHSFEEAILKIFNDTLGEVTEILLHIYGNYETPKNTNCMIHIDDVVEEIIQFLSVATNGVQPFIIERNLSKT
jgi:hypothetical protein